MYLCHRCAWTKAINRIFYKSHLHNFFCRVCVLCSYKSYIASPSAAGALKCQIRNRYKLIDDTERIARSFIQCLYSYVQKTCFGFCAAQKGCCYPSGRGNDLSGLFLGLHSAIIKHYSFALLHICQSKSKGEVKRSRKNSMKLEQ